MTNNKTRTFDYAGLELRVLMIKGEPWFAVRDVCFALNIFVRQKNGYKEVHTSQLRQVVADVDITPTVVGGNDVAGKRKLLTISEPGLYKLIMRSDKPEARKFQDCVTREVLPSIPQDGRLSAKRGSPWPWSGSGRRLRVSA